jgi:hypothetical protein
MATDTYNAGAGRGKQGGPSVEDLDKNQSERQRKHTDAMNAMYDSNAKMLGLTKQEYIKQQSAKNQEALKNAPIEYENHKKGGKISSASSRADGIAQRGKTKGTMVMCGGGMAKGKR